MYQLVEEDPNQKVIGEAGSAEAALEDLATLTPDLLLVDLSLPEMSGLDFIKTLSRQRPELRCLVLTGHTHAYYKEAAEKAGAVGFVPKDDADEVSIAVREVLETA